MLLVCLGVGVWWGARSISSPFQYGVVLLFLVMGGGYGCFREWTQPEILVPTSTVIQGEVLNQGKSRGPSQVFECQISTPDSDLNGEKIHVVTEDPRSFRSGDLLEIRGWFERVPAATNPGAFNERTWCRSRGIRYQCLAHDIRKIQERSGWNRFDFFDIHQKEAKRILGIGFDPKSEVRALIQGMVLGDTSELSRELKEGFRMTGTAHLFAVSGQNLGVIVSFFLFFYSVFFWNRWRWGWVLLIPLVYYMGLSGWQSSCIRAWGMVALLFIAWRIDRPVSWLNFWSCVLFVVLIVDPNLIQDWGYQLSFLVVGGLILGTPWGMERCRSWWHRPRFLSLQYATPFQLLTFRFRYFFASLGVGSCVAFISVLPHSLWIFHQFNLISVGINMLIIPLAGIIVVLGVVSLGVSLIHPLLSWAVNGMNGFITQLLLAIVYGGSLVTSTQISIPDTETWRLSSAPQWIVLDSGEVPQALLRVHGETWLINAGNRKSYLKTLKPVLQYYGVRRLDGVYLTTISDSSNGALSSLLQDYPVKRLIRPDLRSRSPLEKKWGQMIFSDKTIVERWKNEEEHSWGDSLKVKGYLVSEANERWGVEDLGMTLVFSHREQKLIWANRMSGVQEREWIQTKFENENIDFLIQGRHPQSESLTAEWLDYLKPRHCILSDLPESVKRRGYRLSSSPKKTLKGETWETKKTGALIVEWKKGSPQVRSWKSD